MARSIGWKLRSKHRPPLARARCGYCGASWYTSDLRRDRSGILTCPLEGRGRDRVMLDEALIRQAAKVERQVVPDLQSGDSDAIGEATDYRTFAQVTKSS